VSKCIVCQKLIKGEAYGSCNCSHKWCLNHTPFEIEDALVRVHGED